MMRIITGKARGIRLDTLEGEMTRPTTERAKEAIFSMIQFDLEGRRVLDLFAGSGQMGLEAVSRGAAHAVLVDQSKDAVRIINRNVEKTRLGEQCTVICSDFAEYLRQRRGKEAFDYIFLDPPYPMRAVPATVEAIVRSRILKPHGIIICESGEPDPLGFATGTALSARFEVIREAKYGKAYVTVITPVRKPSAEADGDTL